MKATMYLTLVLALLFSTKNFAQPFYDEEETEYLTDQFNYCRFMDHPFPGKQFGFEFRRDILLKELNLTTEQEKQFNDITNEHHKKMIDLRAQIQKNRLDIKNMMLQNKVDEKKLLDLTQANNKLFAEMKTAVVNHWLAIYKILNDEQKEIWAKHWGQGLGLEKRVLIKNKILDRQRKRLHR